MSYLSVSQTAEKWGISTRRIQILWGEGRIPGAMRIGAFWATQMMLQNQQMRESRTESISKTSQRIELREVGICRKRQYTL